MGNTFYFNWEVQLMYFLQQHLGAAATSLIKVITMFGDETLSVVILGYIYWAYNKEFGIYLGKNAVVANIMNPVSKNFFLRRRPYFDHPQIRCLMAPEAKANPLDIVQQGYSFPSGHSTNAAVIYGSIASYLKRTKATVICTCLILAVGASRFCLGVHYPTDVLVGWAMGFICIWLIPRIEKFFHQKWHFYLVLVCISLLGFLVCDTTDYYSCMGLMIGFLGGNLFEEKFVRFDNTSSIIEGILRVIGGLLVYLILNTVLKMPFSKEFLDSATFLSFLIRTIRYSIVLFVMIGVYPLCFRYTSRLTGNK